MHSKHSLSCHTLTRLTSLSMSGIETSSPIVNGSLGQLCHVCVVHPESTRTVRTLLALSYGSTTNLGFEWRFEGSESMLLPPRLYWPPEAGSCGVRS